MDPRRQGSPTYSRQRSGSSASSGSSPPGMSPAHQRSSSSLSSSVSNVKRVQNAAAKAAAARLARVMAAQTNDEDEEEHPHPARGGGGGGLGWRKTAPRQVAGDNSGAAAAAAAGSQMPQRSPSPALGRNIVEHPTSIRSTSVGRSPSNPVRASVMPSSKVTTRASSPIPAVQLTDKSKERRLPSDFRFRDTMNAGTNREASELRDELDMLRDEMDNNRDKLRLAEERCQIAEARARELEKQVASLGEGVSLEAKLLSRKEAALRKREADLKVLAQAKDGRDGELASLRQELSVIKDETVAARDHLQQAESEAKALRSMTQRMILTQEEKEEVVLKRCWLARYWGLAVRYGVHPDIAASKHEYWSSLAPLPFEIVTSAGQKAKESSWGGGDDDPERRNKMDLNDVSGEGNIESMLSVEKALRELASLKVEDAVMLSMAQPRRPNLLRLSTPDSKSPGDPKFIEASELSPEEAEDVFFKQAWLIYFWRRAKAHHVEEDVAEERLQLWINRLDQAPTSHDAVDAERGLIELKKLGIEQQLWEVSRREFDEAYSSKK